MTTPEGAAGWTDEQVAEASIAAVAAGQLPLRAQWRIAEQRERRDRGESGSFTSDLTVEEFAAVRSVGFAPVGQVMGSALYNVGWSYTGCGYMAGRYWTSTPVVPIWQTQQLLNEARHRAVDRMRAECAGLGGDGVVGVRLSVSSFYGNGLEFLAVGTAVRANGTHRPHTPFTSDLTGQDFAKLMRAGWVPVALVQGVGVMIRHDDWTQRAQQSSWFNQEVTGHTKLVDNARKAARDALAEDARGAGGHTVILRRMSMRVSETPCQSGLEGEDHVVEAFLRGTAVVPIETKRPDRPEAPFTMLRLNRSSKGTR